MSDAKIILALDPATYVTGWAIFRINKAGEIKLVKAGDFAIPKKTPYKERMHLFRSKVMVLIDKIKPTHFVIERPFMGMNAQTFLTLAGAYGILCQLAHEKNLPLIAMPPTEAKTHLLGTSRMKGDKSKKLIKKQLEAFYNTKFDNADQSDAVATGVTAIDKYISLGVDERY